jgi:hypothetical protein
VRLVIANSANAEINQGLAELIKEAFSIRNQLPSGSADSIEAMSARLGMNRAASLRLFDSLISLPTSFALSSQAAPHRTNADPALPHPGAQ